MAACLSKEAVSKADTSLLIDVAGDSRLEASDDGGGGAVSGFAGREAGLSWPRGAPRGHPSEDDHLVPARPREYVPALSHR